MPKVRAKYLPIPALIIDGILLLNSFLTAAYIVFQGKFPDALLYYAILLGMYVVWIVIALNYKLYDLPRIIYFDKIMLKGIKALFLYVIVMAAIAYIALGFKFSKSFFIITMSLYGVMFLAWHFMLVVLFKMYRRAGNNYKTIAIVGFRQPVDHLISKVFLRAEHGYKIVAAFGSETVPAPLKKYYKGTEDGLIPYLKEHQVDELVISLPGGQSKLINQYMQYADNNLIRVHIVPNFSSYLFQKFSINYIQNIPTLQLRDEPLESLSNRIMKRYFDVLFAFFALVCIGSWLFPLLALLITLNSKGPVFFSQQRSGKNGAVFNCLKFRSMTVNTHADSVQATKNDARVTRIGNILRKTSLDEFPQFFNVLSGSMSVVGPRPHMLKHTAEYGAVVDKFMVRHFAKPGITGLAQTKGYRGEIKEQKDIDNRAEADIWYIENWNILLDLKIILKTILQVVFKKEENAF